MSILSFVRYEKPLDDISTLINRGGIPTVEQISEKLGEQNASDFWVAFASTYNVFQRSNRPFANHIYDLVERPRVRSIDTVTDLEIKNGLHHDHPENILNPARGENPINGIGLAVGAYVMLDILSDLSSPVVAYGIPITSEDGGKPRRYYGGVISATDFNELLTRHLLKRLDIKTKYGFEARHGQPKYEVRDVDGTRRVYLTDEGRKFFISQLTDAYNQFSISEEEIIKAYKFVKRRYQKFIDVYLPNSPFPLSKENQDKISEMFINKFISKIQEKINNRAIINSQNLEGTIMGEAARIKFVIDNPENEKPADISLILSYENPYIMTLKKTLYGNYIERMGENVIEVARRALKSGKISEEPYLHHLIVKALDLIDTTAGTGPNLDNMTSINRKSRLLLKEDASILAQLNKENIYSPDMDRLYHLLDYLFENLKMRVSKGYRDTIKETDTMFDEPKEILGKMKTKLTDLKPIIKQSKPHAPSRLPHFLGLW